MDMKDSSPGSCIPVEMRERGGSWSEGCNRGENE